MKRQITIAVLALGTLLATASSAFAITQWTGNTHITELYPTKTHFVFMTEYKNTALSTCNGGSRFQVANTHPQYEAITNALTAAFLAGKTVNIYVDGPQSCAMTIDRVRIKR